ncbi:hypothetical protein B0H17DRAFT_1063468 [Mycena rosella]|uniref:Uncharacterized protein n=1 Tax=Mycena rosella TaxID=1033263 RepID=A0AAD7DH06_MYCRO|nr:hypothetical protein B0H17DRAFT_1063468 [Mycena rosella]
MLRPKSTGTPTPRRSRSHNTPPTARSTRCHWSWSCPTPARGTRSPRRLRKMRTRRSAG